jgi:hypothetical protein
LVFVAAALELAEDLGDRGFDPTGVRPSLRLHTLSGENVWSISFAGPVPPSHSLGTAAAAGARPQRLELAVVVIAYAHVIFELATAVLALAIAVRITTAAPWQVVRRVGGVMAPPTRVGRS